MVEAGALHTEAPCRSVGSKQDSLLPAETRSALLPAQHRDPSPAPAAPPPGGGEGPGRRAKKETCGAEEGPGSASSCHLWAVWLSPLFERRPKPPAISPGAVSCRVCSGPAAAAHLPSTHFGAALPGRVWERRLHPILILGVFRANPSPSRSQLGLAPSRAPGAIWPCHFPHPFLLAPWCKTVHVAGPFAPGEPATLSGRAPCASTGC